MKALLTIILFLICYSLPAPGRNELPILKMQSTNPYLPILKACIEIESRGDSLAYSFKEDAAGILQIRPIRLKQYFIETGIYYSLNDCFNPDISKKIFLHFAAQFNPYDYKAIAKDWNKSKSDYYWNLVKAKL
jgi:hypothetical protein